MNTTWMDLSTDAWTVGATWAGETGEYLNGQWAALNAAYSPFAIYWVGMQAVSGGMFWGLGLLYLCVDLFRPALVAKYKIQDTANVPLDLAKLRHMLKRVVFNTVVINGSLGVLGYYLAVLRGVRIDAPLPSVLEILLHLVIFVVVQEIGFYYSHRLMHLQPFYKSVHKIHHEWTSPIGLAAQYAHPLEQVVCNLAPIFLGPLICGSHTVTLWIWLAIALFDTVTRHSGYHLPYGPSPEFHDYHHKVFNVNYGGSHGLLDWLHGTDGNWTTSLQKDHDIYLTSFDTVKEYVARAKDAQKATAQGGLDAKKTS
eukprot:Unigene1691_Nuclearia_a/m.5210 Unigene1691_Nuclearia_a/g.5210  ORF Unigene1691_Nuclearia_a/g.5210 Unigene1691_Nuclearia_a/m.5210 type:complete len:312 (-) Unigene1691_Nuclearia_a:84-1019(-)